MRLFAVVVMAFLVAVDCGMAEGKAGSSNGKQLAQVAAERMDIANSLRPSMVVVEYWLKYDGGELPFLYVGLSENFSFHDLSMDTLSDLVSEERPLEVPGFVVGKRLILSEDTGLHPRFIHRIRVRFGEESTAAKPVGFAEHSSSVLLKTDAPLNGTMPLSFKKQVSPPYLYVAYVPSDGKWVVATAPFSMVMHAVPGKNGEFASDGPCLLVGAGGEVGAVFMRKITPVDGIWKDPPLSWPMISAEEHKKALGELKSATEKSLLPVTLGFRSPSKNNQQTMMGMMSESAATEMQTVGILVNRKQLLILALLDAKTTARLESIRVAAPDGKKQKAEFVGSLKDYGALVAELESPVQGAVSFCETPLRGLRDKLLFLVDLSVKGEQRIARYWHSRIRKIVRGHKNKLVPELERSAEDAYLFNRQGELVAFPVTIRKKVGEDIHYRSDLDVLMFAAQMKAILNNLESSMDPNLIPLSEEEENRVAWLGVVLQPLGRDLARANNVSRETRDGMTGGLVTYVYKNSPAAEKGIKPGDILLRIHAPDLSKPAEITASRSFSMDRPFPWDRLDELPEEYFDRVPQPWPTVANRMTAMLTELGIGTEYEIEFISDGEKVRKKMVASESPPHFASVQPYKCEKLGMTVRDMTFEVRRYLQKDADSPGVVVSSLEPGSKASVSGVRPYELITQVNGQAVTDVKKFEELVGDAKEIKLSVSRMSQTRQIRIQLD